MIPEEMKDNRNFWEHYDYFCEDMRDGDYRMAKHHLRKMRFWVDDENLFEVSTYVLCLNLLATKTKGVDFSDN
jgi:hypothetical protein